ncbi:MAG: hypothetical protein P1P81_05975 [Desulfobulbales bacterium]|nr:hypothetical protein [Desulfobulbales bacterium]
MELRFAFPINSDRHLAALKKDPNSLYHRTIDQWFSVRIERVVPREIKLSLVMAAILVVLFIISSLLLKKKLLPGSGSWPGKRICLRP